MASDIENQGRKPVSVYAALSRPLLPWQTRLIKLLPGSLGHRLVAEMLVADLTPFDGLGIHRGGRYQQYEALSYSWGYPVRTAEIEVNGKIAYIPPLMADALQYLRQTAEPRWLWCDALCIDQENPAEKSNQVQVMMLIFSKACRVVAWLGMPPTTGITTVPQSSPVDVEPKHGSPTAQNTAILSLAQVPFFERTWIRQEIYAAREVMFQSGRLKYAFHSFMNIAKKHDSPVVRTRIETFQRTYSTFNISAMSASKEKMSSMEVWERRKIANDTMNSILAVLLGNKVFNCSDERDRVYALVGMAQNIAGGHLIL
ncbi:heterokaryon incompatibility protein-domain-containing protein [Exophiala viscosa]|uniref:Heterokaryon incompatibility protein-domain-containing protein n=1 Tax=Exophiala viscosa TaxID=2486360 RepID=A0AAN6IDG4_9EURO|nr:heterokaryon incompatibility protein-domain-containing protein [Exophiala viscosa]